MLQLIWGLLNIGLIIYFLWISFRAVKLVKERFGLFAAIVFVLGLLAFANTSKDGSTKMQEWTSTSNNINDCNETFFVNAELEENLVSTKLLSIHAGNKKQGNDNVALSANTLINGFTSGINWEVISIAMNETTDNNQLDYMVIGVVNWKLLGITIYKQPKTFKGVVSIEKVNR
ncbi:hypothetical protein [Plebeiibacterium sediminum]|uniref:Uncharacterized protein n=1 Tax=Plebeiibacterium sediminum TaxID=2992112 RepID=A0AAE3SHM3_9BACT|nr:hypothetical protein [Plebeiobacterium sediminum]MCW3789778.1 hypothetical protein [Plebeiobacterium sediminum]